MVQTSNNRGNARFQPYNRNKTWVNKPRANVAGNPIPIKINSDKIDSGNIKFIADSGATEHIIKKALILTNFEKCKNKVIKSANKNRKADIKIDGKGNLFLKTIDKPDKIIELTDVISAGNISSNLLSLRKFVDAGLSIYLDNQILRIYDKESDQIYIIGKYEKPNWLIEFSIISTNKSDNLENYSCSTQIVTVDEFLSQSQTGVQDIINNISKPENIRESNDSFKPSEQSEKLIERLSKIGRE